MWGNMILLFEDFPTTGTAAVLLPTMTGTQHEIGRGIRVAPGI